MCKKEMKVNPIVQKTPTSVSSVALTFTEYENLYDSVLMAAQWGLLDISKSATFKALVNTEVGYEFDGDVNVLLKKLAENYTTLEADMETSISLHYANPSLLTKFVSQAVNGFTYFDKFVYPQIYIPFDDQVTLTDNPVVTLNLNDSTVLPGVYITGSNILVNQVVDEDFAGENLVWVISVNETVLSEADYNNIDELNINTDTIENPLAYDTAVIKYN